MKNGQKHSDDPTESWLRQTLGDFRPETPGDAWSRLEPNLPRKKERRPPVLWWQTGVGAAIAGALFWFVKKEAEIPPVYMQKTRFEVAATFGNPAGEIDKSVAKDSIPEKYVPSNTSSRRSGSLSGEKVARIQTAGTADAAPGCTPLFSDEILSTPPTSIAYCSKTGSFEKLPACLPVAGRQHPNLRNLQIYKVENRSPAPISRLKRPRFRLQTHISPIFYRQKHTDETPQGLAFPETASKPGNGWQSGISLAVEPRANWRITLGIQYFQLAQPAGHIAALRLMDGVCLNPNDPGVKKYKFQYAVISGGQRSDLTLRLEQEYAGSTMPNDEPFMLNMKTVRHSTAWRLPLGLERHFGSGRWRGFVRGGAVLDFSEKVTLEVTHYTEACQDLCFSTGLMPAIEMQPTPGVSVGWLAGTGIERHFSSNIALRFEPFLIGGKNAWQGGISVGLLLSN